MNRTDWKISRRSGSSLWFRTAIRRTPPQIGYTIAMYESLTHFLQTFSVEYRFLWAVLVMAVTAAAGLVLYGFWELVLRGVGLALSGGRRQAVGRPGRPGRPGRGGH